ncbi:MAG: AAA family ATPase [Bacillota bacterium]
MKRIALSKTNFTEIIKNDFIYVDKTKYLYEIVNSNEPYYFLSRPRRFGKTLFLDTLKTFFEGKRELFKDLYVYDKDWEWEEYPVIRLDFNNILTENKEVLKDSIRKKLNEIAKIYGLEMETNKAYYQFSDLVKKLFHKYNKGVVILIDEYDKPIISNLGKDIDNLNDKKRLKIAKENQEFLKIFYDNLKPLESYLQLVFITGVSKFSKVSIFSTLNNLIELDMHPRFSTILGYTEEELRNNFREHFKVFANKLEISLKELYDKFKMMYNGFRFSDEAEKVYNPYSIAKALDYQKIDNYWFESGTPTFLIDLIKEQNFDVTRLDNLEVGRNKLKAYDITKLKLIPLLFQTGYLTIKEIEDNIIYTLGYPNYEVERGLTQNLLEEFTEDRVETPIIHRIKKSLLTKNYDQFMEYMKSLFAGLANINIPKSLQDREHYYHSIFYLTGILFSDSNLGVYSELLTAEGRIDMLVETDENVFIIEFKCNQSAEKAVEQIKEKNYADKFKVEGKEIVLMGISFATEDRNLGNYIIEEKNLNNGDD